MDNSSKVYVGVKARFEPNGKLFPLSIAWEDGHEYEIDRVLNVCRAAMFGSEETNRQMSGEYDQNQPETKKPLPKLFQPL